jgi:hypothetical protein
VVKNCTNDSNGGAKANRQLSPSVPAVQQQLVRPQNPTACFLALAVDPVLPDALVYVASCGETANQLGR